MGQWRGPRTANDPLLTTRHWRVTIRGHWQRLRLPCAVCHSKIDYTGPQYFITINGRKVQNPRTLVVGHIISRYEARRRGWSEEQTNRLENTRPECRRCSNKSGARLGQQVQAAKAKRATAYRW